MTTVGRVGLVPGTVKVKLSYSPGSCVPAMRNAYLFIGHGRKRNMPDVDCQSDCSRPFPVIIVEKAHMRGKYLSNQPPPPSKLVTVSGREPLHTSIIITFH